MATTAEPPRPGGSGAQDVRRLRLDLAYDGAAFRGFAENAGVQTVAGDLRAAIERVLGQTVALTCAGRTDAGVHARGQVVTVDVVADEIDPVRLRNSLNSQVGPQVVVREVTEVPATFDARFSACWRRYRYLVLDTEVPDPFLATTTWWTGEPLDVAAMDRAAQVLVGEHDFSSFCRRPRQEPAVSLVRHVHHARWERLSAGSEQEPSPLRFEIVASAFCHQMVRSIVGALVKVGRGRMEPEQVGALLAARDRAGAPNLAPPQGLTLWEVGYQPWGVGAQV
jgi:tRNA pseudouridine38-40 synthase